MLRLIAPIKVLKVVTFRSIIASPPKRKMARMKQFFLLLWKNFKLQLRHPWITVFELGVPLIFSLLLVLIRIFVESEYVSEPTVYKPFQINQIPTPEPIMGFAPSIFTVLYAPNDTAIQAVMEKINVNTIGFMDENSLEKYYLSLSDNIDDILAAVVFDSAITNSTVYSPNIKYRIRPKAIESSLRTLEAGGDWQTKLNFPFIQTLGPRSKDDNFGGAPGYMSRGFLPLQHAVAMSIIDLISSNFSESEQIDLEMERYPYPPYDNDQFLVYLQFYLPLIIMFSFMYPFVNIVKNLVLEKERKLREAMKMMGLSQWLNGSAWFLKYLVFLCILIVVITACFTIKFKEHTAVLMRSDPTVIFFVLLVYATSTICFSFFLSAFFSKANSASVGAGIVFAISITPYMFLFPRYSELSLSTKLSSCLLLNTGASLGCIIITLWESTGYGLQWDVLGKTVTPDDHLTMNLVLFMMILDGVFYLVLGWYIEAVFPGEYGVPEVWYFPFTRSYWCGATQDFQNVPLYNYDGNRLEFFEKEPTGFEVGIQIQGLTKVYNKKHIPAVNNLYVNMYQGQITVLLGHNGAGKTTTISMLTGLFPPTSGEAWVNGADICGNIEGVHSSLGICPQHDILFDDLTVEEHFHFFASLKNYLPDEIPSDVNRMIRDVGLQDKRSVLAKNLSGGMKRKLSVGIAFVGGSKVVMLDEPTSGMDPSARRAIWDLIQVEKDYRTILLTTHFMEEADILGDRIAIMADGELQCCGSPLFLKKKYGAGYHLVIVKMPACNVNRITDLIVSHIPNAEMAKNIGAELTYILPHESSPKFENLFSEIETSQEKLNISSFGASITTMEEVFIKVGQKASVKDLVVANEENLSTRALSMTDSGAHDLEDEASVASDTMSAIQEEFVKNSGLALFYQQLLALLQKRILYNMRNWPLTLSMFILPPFFLVLTLIILKTIPKPEDNPPLLLNLDKFGGTTVPYVLNSSRTENLHMATLFASQFNHKVDHPELLNDQNLTAYLLKEGKNDISYYNMHNMIAASVEYQTDKNKTLLTSLFNNQAYHSPAIALWSIDNMLLKYVTNESNEFSVTNHPLPRTATERGTQAQFHLTDAYEISQAVLIGLAIVSGSVAVFLVKERFIRSKHLQQVSGVNLFSFWLAVFLWDYICYIITCLCMMVVFFAMGIEGFSSAVQQGRLLLLFIVCGFALLPAIYCFSFVFQQSSSAYVSVGLVNALVGIAAILIVTVMEIPQINMKDAANALDWIFTILIPNYCLGRSTSNLYQNYQFNNICNFEGIEFICDLPFSSPLKVCCPGKCGDLCIPWEKDYFSWNSPGIGKQLVFLSIQSLFFFLLLTTLELRAFRYLKYQMKFFKSSRSVTSISTSSDVVEDDDVTVERQKIVSTPLDSLRLTNRLILKQLSKNYGSLVAVNNLSLGIRRGECFGLLGLNGAGKTTTFKMITGEKSITSGDVFLDGFSVRTSLRKVQQRLGYCPQFDALIDQLTGRETLTMYARLRGLPESMIPDQVSRLSSLLAFGIYIDKQVKEYSGGNKRKLSVAIALIGDPPMIFLDEPTSGMDPVSRHSIWNVLLRVLRSGRSIVLTSHSMEECEALCNKLVIMVNGKLCCFGSPQHLKSKFGQGFTLLIKVGRRSSCEYQQMSLLPNVVINTSDDIHYHPPHQHRQCLEDEVQFKNDIQLVKSFIEQTFAGSVLKDVHEGFLHYHIPNPKLSWSEVFGAIERAKSTLNILDYSVGQTTLEQVFLNFARAQRESNDI